ncbi:MAG: YggS family pyridoxal phosphate-dependent enzyme [Enterobacterales bacterium]|nr:YggS family pyridoxal phosphate-dependent enzyme [Enterobacterales bacterium]
MNACHLEKVLQRIENSVNKYNQKVSPVRLIAVSKTRPTTSIVQAYSQGQRDFGESYVQEAVEKVTDLEDLDICWHFIGPVQSNKTKLIAMHFDWVQSVDRLKIARRLSAQRPSHLPPLNICIQVNISNDPDKSGIAPEDMTSVVKQIIELPNLKLRGMMVIPKQETTFAAQRAIFAEAMNSFKDLQKLMPSVDTLSMGMSADLEAAIAEGSNMVRIGTDIFGPREK